MRCCIYGDTYSSRIHDPTESPPQLMPPAKLPIVLLSRRGLSFIEMGLAPLPKKGEPTPLLTEPLRPPMPGRRSAKSLGVAFCC